MRPSTAFFFFSSILLLGGCSAVPTPFERQQTLDTLALKYHLQSQKLHTALFSLYSLSDTGQCENKEMRVFIEGDGLAWKTRSHLSDNPTPINPLAAKLMSLDTSECKVYLARPCQYMQDKGCNSLYWSDRRFSPEVIESYSQALDQLQNRYRNNTFVLIGYSGGGAIAALTAARRKDIAKLITVAGNLDTTEWIKYHGLSPLEGSLNPSDFASALESTPQIHFIGSQDTVIPKEIFLSYQRRFKHPESIRYEIIDGASHSTGWEGIVGTIK